MMIVVTMLQMHGFLIAGDLIFSGSVGRTDFPYSNPGTMESSLKRIMELPDDTKVIILRFEGCLNIIAQLV
jgi:hydroxyacylglutathione hydrolase